MICFSVDGFPLNNDHNLSFDYNSKIIYSAITDPLFKYSKEQECYVPNACESFSTNRTKNKYVLKLRDDLFFSNGCKVTAVDYKKAIEKLLKSNSILKVYFKNIVSIQSDKELIINLAEPDENFIKKLSMYQICPNKGGLSSGMYKVSKTNQKEWLLVPNKYYRFLSKESIKFIKTENEWEHIKLFEKMEIDVTNNTLFPKNAINMFNNINIEESLILYCIEISTQIPNKIRKEIINSINKKEIAKEIGNYSQPINSFHFSEYKKIKKVKATKYKETLKVLYNKFYPNEKVARKIVCQLNKAGFKAELFSHEYGDDIILKQPNIKLVLNYFEYIDSLFFYESLYFSRLMNNSLIYSYLLSKYKAKNNRIILNLINLLFKNKNVKEPLVHIKSIYLTNDKTNIFSFLELDYRKISKK